MVARYSAGQWGLSPALQRLVRPGAVVVDAGANVGYVTALLARWVGPEGRVHSFEPVPETFDLLARAVRRLKLKQVRLHPQALSDAAGAADMRIPRYADGRENLYESTIEPRSGADGDARVVRIETVRLDDILGEDAGRVTFIKMDVEGHEERALAGAQAVLERARPALFVEIDGDLDDATSSAGRLAARLSALGYGVYLWDSGWRARRPGESAVDYFFLMPYHTQA
jgi:FkbM family methyltransferase